MKPAIPALAVLLGLAACDHQNTPSPRPANTATTPESAAGTPADASDSVAFQQLSERMVEDLWQLFPSWAVHEGYYAAADRLQVPDDAYRERVLAFVRDYRRQFGEIDSSGLDANASSDLSLIRNFLDRTEWEITEFRGYQWNPAQYNVSSTFAVILKADYAPLDERLRTFSTRMAKVPDYYAAAEQSLGTPAAPQLALAIQQNEGALSVFDESLEQKLAGSGLDAGEKAQFNRRLEATRSAIRNYIAFLQDRQKELDETRQYRDFRIGEKLYEEKFHYEIQIDMTAEQLYQRALQEKARLHEQMAGLADKLWPEYFPNRQPPQDRLERIAAVLEKLSLHHATKETFKAEVEKQIPELAEFVTRHDLLSLDPGKPLVVRTTPPYMRGFSVASINAPGPYDKGANTYYNVMPTGELGDEQAESFLREYNSYLMQILNIHEAIPGHYTQLVYANRSPSLIKSILGNGAMIEGWAVYAERMMLEAGYGDFSPELWLMYYKWNLRTVTNTILDYEIQVKGIDEDRAMELMVKDAFQQKAEAAGKWRRATLSQVQLTSYFAGYADILALREEMKEQLGENFDLKAFHEQFLSYGSAPVPVIRGLMLEKLDVKS
ncbi:DUF885 domain-containing protein [Microbulbifer litoralis]|uniref:DUF885 domain-containing protein n=1 Tax=Microbulbifer litoralis TaxID=2933965 RepID=UPI0020295E74|nr:DUF885 domain-containing protein [Microbulbifer sp. GX H0434]